ncbi:aminotransferase class I/II-fold pyridoxal phosphate-dependent enzyme [Specibacter cremeus]|uniref:aminotransferase class I/II-fold pyridoxal phosphate-dependent enzyme n=1 Tax=Specibacter cremeus TaxID=1629051 RepID=UPI000F76865B|nr:beta-eliminating lyase-related protein [Specibacter cremeus]
MNAAVAPSPAAESGPLQRIHAAATRPAVGTPSSAWRLRTDSWDFLAYTTKQLTAATKENGLDVLLAESFRLLDILDSIELYFASPGLSHMADLRMSLTAKDFGLAAELIDAVRDGLGDAAAVNPDPPVAPEAWETVPHPATATDSRRRFEVLVIDDLSPVNQEAFKRDLLGRRRNDDEFVYDVNIVPSFEDALIAVLLNPEIQACVIRPGFAQTSRQRLGHDLRRYLDAFTGDGPEPRHPVQRILRLAKKLCELRPELDLYLVAGVAIEKVAGSLTSHFRRIFARQDGLEIHLSLLRGVAGRFETPFFTALQHYSKRPAGVFHALPVSRGGSVVNSKWIKDMVEFYGLNLLLAETSATSGGLDSLLDPHGPIRDAQKLAARAFGAQKTYFVTNGTSTANKIVHQSIIAPGDVVLVDRNCHKSHHYAMMLAGARVAYLDAYPLNEQSFYGAVPLRSIKQTLLDYRRAGRLHEVKMITLTNCTFDGIVYDVERVMSECLAIKPDLVFLWDEAWFAFAGFHPLYRRRTAMAASRKMEQDFQQAAYAQRHAEQARALHDQETGQPVSDEKWLAARLVPDPAKARLRVYATQSTHKTLTSLRQGSMIHVYDQDFSLRNEDAFREAYMTHTSTSPNYQILASLDIGRRQAELEGYELIQRQADLAVSIAQTVARHPLLRKYFKVLTTRDLIPAEYRRGRLAAPLRGGLAAMDDVWRNDEFVVDPCRLTLDIGLTGIDGDTFKHVHLMDRFGIQVNKTSRNSVLLMTNIGTSRSSVAYLIEVLVKLAETFERDRASLSPADQEADRSRVRALTSSPPPLPDFSRFAARYRSGADTPDGDIRAAHFDTYRNDATAYLAGSEIVRRVKAGEEIVSAGFVTPYPPGFPVLVPGQIITLPILDFMAALDTREIHGYSHRHGYRVMAPEARSPYPPAADQTPAPSTRLQETR